MGAGSGVQGWAHAGLENGDKEGVEFPQGTQLVGQWGCECDASPAGKRTCVPGLPAKGRDHSVGRAGAARGPHRRGAFRAGWGLPAAVMPTPPCHREQSGAPAGHPEGLWGLGL